MGLLKFNPDMIKGGQNPTSDTVSKIPSMGLLKLTPDMVKGGPNPTQPPTLHKTLSVKQTGYCTEKAIYGNFEINSGYYKRRISQNKPRS
jgi:hypothetical protein